MVTIRQARPNDLDDLLGLVEEYSAADGHEFEPSVARAGVEPLLRDDSYGVIWVADDSAGLAGYAVVTWGWSIEIGGLDVVLDEIYVRRRGDGIGSTLIEHLERDCVARGVRRIFLETELANDGARRLYQHLGYTADTSIWMAKALT